MIFEYTEQEKQRLIAVDEAIALKLDKLDKIILNSKKDSAEYQEATKEATRLADERQQAFTEIYKQVELKHFKAISGSTDSIIQNAKEQTEAIINNLYQTMLELYGRLKGDEKSPSGSLVIPIQNIIENEKTSLSADVEQGGIILNATQTLAMIRSGLHLHFEALEGNADALKAINDYIIAAVTTSPYIAKYDATAPLKEDYAALSLEAFLPMYHGKPTTALATMSSRKAEVNKITGGAVIESKGVKLIMQEFTNIKGTLGINTHKLFNVGITSFTALNNEADAAKKNIEYKVSIPLEDYCLKCGYDILEHAKATKEEQTKEKRRAANALKDAKKRIRRDLEVLSSSRLSWEEPNRRFKDKGDFNNIALIGSYGIRQGYIYMVFDPLFSEYLVKLPITQYPLALLGVDARNPTAYNIGLKMATHYSMDNNQIKGTYNLLKVKTLLAATDLPPYEEVVLSRKGWEERLKEPLENAMDHLTQINFLSDWRYSKSKGETLEDTGADFTDYETWADTLVQYDIANAPNHNDRIKKLEEKKKATKADKKKNN